jgi:hypothetical protein
MEIAYDPDYGMEFQHSELADALERLGKLVSLDQELLALAAIARWLDRNRVVGLRDALCHRYRLLSSQVSGGATSDCWGLIEDLD